MKDCQQKCNDGSYQSKLPYVRWTCKDMSDEDKSANLARREDEQRLKAEFWADLDDFCGIKDSPEEKRSLLHSIAWELGHSSGYSEVLYYAFEMAPLIK